MIFEKYIFLIGRPRSGTSWIADWIGLHDQITTGPESRIFFHIPQKELAINSLSKWASKEKLMNEVKKFVDNFYATRKKCNEIYLFDRTGGNFQRRELISTFYPQAYFILLCRDGKSHIHSMLKTQWQYWDKFSTTKKLEIILQKWIDVAEVITNPLTELDKNALKIRYEDLVLNPIETSRKITNFISIDHHCDIKPWAHPLCTIHKKYEPDLWKNLSCETLNKMKIMNNYLIELGYEPIE